MSDKLSIGVSVPRDNTHILRDGQAVIEEFTLSIESDGELTNPNSIPKLKVETKSVYCLRGRNFSTDYTFYVEDPDKIDIFDPGIKLE